ncbi:hypothetical protein K2173_020416 [Erythroxylum novogranatense]|uniref:Cytochrome b5 heme-binding domain-containing protein n=1 Tax=Erythroxylum novogranatense TaxID=1862640 RepID=A0AAV8TIS6_9ROSI|nr:hypothetical protein K2173_020416 [Erythroxylum novogranatense]
MGVNSMVMDSIEAYTGLSPTAFFTIAALMVIVYKIVCGMFLGPEDFKKTPREPVNMGNVTEQELRAYDGSDPNKPILVAIKGQIYDVSDSRMLYGPGGPYAMFAGREVSRAFALLSFNPRDFNANLEDLGEAEFAILQDWVDKFEEKYVKVGKLVSVKPNNGDK